MLKRFKVSIFIDTIRVGGGPSGYVYNLKKGLEEVGKEYNEKVKINIITFDTTLYPKKKGVLEVVQKNRRRFSFYIKRPIRKIVALYNSDLIVFQGYQNPKWMRIAQKKGVKTAYMPHSPTIVADEVKMDFELNSKEISKELYNKYYVQEEELFEKSDILFFPCENAMTSYRKHWNNIIDQKKIYFVKSGTIVRESSDFDKYQVKKNDNFVVGFIGRYVTHKGYDIFVDAAKKNKDKSISFVSAGAGSLRNSAVTDFGFISDIGSFIKQCDVVVIPNRFTYYDLLPIECAACGKPLVMSNVGGNIDQSKDFSDSILFESENTMDLLDKIKIVREKYNENKNYGLENKKVYEQEFTAVEFAKRWCVTFSYVLS